MHDPCLPPPHRSEAFAEDLLPPSPLTPPARRGVVRSLPALAPLALALALVLAAGAATLLLGSA